ncbi:GNAT family N-acetyltransferase [Achromobacter ruhlandii]|uniref:GNAT family N-acetyltransferase n=1 Tax=Achromobacter ruhlandii TaxID=72557 RepID=UPI003BA11DBC
MSEFEYRPIERGADLDKILDLMKVAFPAATIFTPEYLKWLYWENPVGDAVGFNCWAGNELVGHVASLPQRVVIKGQVSKAILLLNVATHPRTRGKGHFVGLVKRTIEAATEQGFAAVLGVANAQTYRAYELKFKFQNVAGLAAHIEMLPHSLEASQAIARADLFQKWDDDSLAWRLRNPNNRLKIVSSGVDCIVVEGKSSMPVVRSRAIIPRNGMQVIASRACVKSLGPAVVIGLAPEGTLRRRIALDVPNKLRPSPLRLVYKNLKNPADTLNPASVLFSFLDFDAF